MALTFIRNVNEKMCNGNHMQKKQMYLYLEMKIYFIIKIDNMIQKNSCINLHYSQTSFTA